LTIENSEMMMDVDVVDESKVRIRRIERNSIKKENSKFFVAYRIQ